MRKPRTSTDVGTETGLPPALVESVRKAFVRERILFYKIVDASLRRAAVVAEFDRLIRRFEQVVASVGAEGANFERLADPVQTIWGWLSSRRSGLFDESTLSEMAGVLFGPHRLVSDGDALPVVDDSIEWSIEDLHRLKIATGRCRSMMDMMLMSFRLKDESAHV